MHSFWFISLFPTIHCTITTTVTVTCLNRVSNCILILSLHLISITTSGFPFRGRVGLQFKQYIPSKLAKYGIKIWWCCDAGTSYPLNSDVYLGGQPNEPRQTNQGSSVVKKLVEPWYRSGRNVVGDNFFTSCELAEFLLLQNLIYVGTIRRNKTDIPEET